MEFDFVKLYKNLMDYISLTLDFILFKVRSQNVEFQGCFFFLNLNENENQAS